MGCESLFARSSPQCTRGPDDMGMKNSRLWLRFGQASLSLSLEKIKLLVEATDGILKSCGALENFNLTGN